MVDMMKRLIPVLILVVLISGCTSTAKYTADNLPGDVQPTGEHPVGNSIGDRAPDFALTATDGQNLSLSSLSGKPVVLYFMTTWCPYCKEEYKEIEKVFPANNNIQFISVGIDMKETSAMLENYRTTNNRPGMFAPGNEQILRDYNVIYTTTKYVISGDGTVLYKGSGVLSSENWKIIFDSVNA